MPVQDYYFARRAVPRFGKMFFLKVPHEAEGIGGGRSLLGSVVQEVRESLFGLGIFARSEFPIPRHMSVPGIVRQAIEKRKTKLGLNAADEVVLTLALAGANESITIKTEASLVAGIGAFPSIPADLGIDINYALMKEATLQLGPKSQLQYIPLGYLGRLYAFVKGKHRQVVPSGAIEDNNIVDTVLLAKNFHVTFHSDKDFDAKFDAKLQTYA